MGRNYCNCTICVKAREGTMAINWWPRTSGGTRDAVIEASLAEARAEIARLKSRETA